jgi:predicted amidohydrolase
MAQDRLTVALHSEVFPDAHRDEEARGRLAAALAAARGRGAVLVVLPELPVHPWSPAQQHARPEDAEPPLGPRHRMLAAVSEKAGVALLAGAIVEEGGVRRNRALLFGRDGSLLTSYDKAHLPHEEGFWETSHYKPGNGAPKPVWVDGFPLGVQLCSDLNRPELGHALAAAGALAIVGPRATQTATWSRWRLVLQATAMTACCYVLSVTRPGPEQGVPLGGPSLAVGPDGNLLFESHDTLSLVTLESSAVQEARKGYPGYLTIRPELYARAWEQASRAMAIEAAAAADDTEDEEADRPTTQVFELRKD